MQQTNDRLTHPCTASPTSTCTSQYLSTQISFPYDHRKYTKGISLPQKRLVFIRKVARTSRPPIARPKVLGVCGNRAVPPCTDTPPVQPLSAVCGCVRPFTQHCPQIGMGESSEIGDVSTRELQNMLNGEVYIRGVKVHVRTRARQEIVKVRRH